jgi:hypothetical protein
MSNEELKYLTELLLKLRKANDTLAYSYNVCLNIGEKAAYDEEEMDRFESLTSKFARLSDLIVKQCIKTIDLLDLDEPPETMRDTINRAEKKGLISSADRFVVVRRLRNAIAHEYAVEDLVAIYTSVLHHVPDLFDSVQRIEKYAGKFRH